MLRIDDYLKGQLVTIGWRYGQLYGQGGHLAPCMVMGCIANRVRKGWGDWLNVLDTLPNYAAERELPKSTPVPWEPSFIKLLHEVDSIFDGSGIDYAKQAVYWADLRHIETEFFKKAILAHPEDHPRVVEMNSLALFL